MKIFIPFHLQNYCFFFICARTYPFFYKKIWIYLFMSISVNAFFMLQKSYTFLNFAKYVSFCLQQNIWYVL